MAPTTSEVVVGGALAAWSPATLDFKGPLRAQNPETFRDFRFDVVFEESASGQRLSVPGYFAADGDAARTGAQSGAVWRVRFTPPSAGMWRYQAVFRAGADVALRPERDAGRSLGPIDGASGAFEVARPTAKAPDLRAFGPASLSLNALLFARSGKQRERTFAPSSHLFTLGPTLSGAADDGEATGEAPAVTPRADLWRVGDPVWATPDEGRESRGAVGAARAIAASGATALWVAPIVLRKARLAASPWAAAPAGEAEAADAMEVGGLGRCFDVARLERWALLLDRLEALGVAIHFALRPQGAGPRFGGAFDGVRQSVVRQLLAREIIARFGHLNGLVWGLGDDAAAGVVARLDAYNHPQTPPFDLQAAPTSQLSAGDRGAAAPNEADTSRSTAAPTPSTYGSPVAQKTVAPPTNDAPKPDDPVPHASVNAAANLPSTPMDAEVSSSAADDQAAGGDRASDQDYEIVVEDDDAPVKPVMWSSRASAEGSGPRPDPAPAVERPVGDDRLRAARAFRRRIAEEQSRAAPSPEVAAPPSDDPAGAPPADAPEPAEAELIPLARAMRFGGADPATLEDRGDADLAVDAHIVDAASPDRAERIDRAVGVAPTAWPQSSLILRFSGADAPSAHRAAIFVEGGAEPIATSSTQPFALFEGSSLASTPAVRGYRIAVEDARGAALKSFELRVAGEGHPSQGPASGSVSTSPAARLSHDGGAPRLLRAALIDPETDRAAAALSDGGDLRRAPIADRPMTLQATFVGLDAGEPVRVRLTVDGAAERISVFDAPAVAGGVAVCHFYDVALARGPCRVRFEIVGEQDGAPRASLADLTLEL